MIEGLMVKGFALLEACLFSQASFEGKRIAFMRETISSREKAF